MEEKEEKLESYKRSNDLFGFWRLYAVWYLQDYKIREFLRGGSFAVTEEEWEKSYALYWRKALKDIENWNEKKSLGDKGIWKCDGYVFVAM